MLERLSQIFVDLWRKTYISKRKKRGNTCFEEGSFRERFKFFSTGEKSEYLKFLLVKKRKQHSPDSLIIKDE